MPASPDSTAGTNELLCTLAILEQADGAMLATVVDRRLSEAELAALGLQPDVQFINGRFRLEPAAAANILAVYEQSDLPGYRAGHERALQVLLAKMQGGDTAVESSLMAVFERLANRLLLDDPARLIDLVEQMEKVPWQTAVHQQKQRYFQGVAYRKAERYHDALAVLTGLLAEAELNKTVRGRTLNSRAICYRLLGQLEKALADNQASLALWQQLADRLNEGKAWLNMGIIAYELQNYSDAAANLQQATEILTEVGSITLLGIAQNELGIVYRDQGRWAEALACFEAYVALRQADKAYDSVGRGLNNVGEILLFQGHLAEAISAFQAALEKMTTRVYRIDTHLYLGLAYQAMGKLNQAKEAFTNALETAVAINRHEILPHAHYRLGSILAQLGEKTAALTQYKLAAQSVETARAPLRDEGLRISLVGKWQQIYETLVLYHLEQGDTAAAFAWAERSRARAFADALAGDGENAAVQQVAALTEIQAALPAESALLCYFTTGVLAHDLPMLRTLPTTNPLRVQMLTPARTILFIVTTEKITAYDCGLDPNLLTINSPRSQDHTRFLTDSVRRHLYAVLLEEAMLTISANQVYIIPHGPLHHLPFLAFIDGQGRPLLHHNGPTVAYAPSATVLTQHCLAATSPLLRQETQPQANGLAVGYNGWRGEHQLQYTEAEVKAVAQLLSGKAWTGEGPKKTKLRPHVEQCRWLHIACHACFDHEKPLASYLETGLGERITAREIMQEWRLSAELVTLSACQTGVSRVLRGDEPMGLIRAFLYAGARAVLVSRWPVEDLPTCLLMIRFYQIIQARQKPAFSQALHDAQLWLRQLTVGEARERWAALNTAVPQPDPFAALAEESHPFDQPRFWASFMLVGRH